MTSQNSKQMTSGKSFEYALLAQFEEKLEFASAATSFANSN